MDALAAYRRGGAYRKAVELARTAAPAQVSAVAVCPQRGQLLGCCVRAGGGGVRLARPCRLAMPQTVGIS